MMRGWLVAASARRRTIAARQRVEPRIGFGDHVELEAPRLDRDVAADLDRDVAADLARRPPAG